MNMSGIECGGIPIVEMSPGEFLVLAEDAIGGDHTWHDALEACRSLTLGGFSDWRLPTQDELYMLFEASINNTDYGFGRGWYWSSTEFGDDYAWMQYFSDGCQDNSYKWFTYSVRAVRAHKI